jgi:hypothetical protein
MISNGVRLVDLFDVSIVRLQAALLSRQVLLAIGGLHETLRIAMDLIWLLGFSCVSQLRIWIRQSFFTEGTKEALEAMRSLDNWRTLTLSTN